MTSHSTRLRGAGITTSLILALAIQAAIPPFATDAYTPALPQVTGDLQASSLAVGLTLTMFFLGFGAGQLTGGPLSDQLGRRRLMIVGGLICTLGAVGCALAPSIFFLITMRLVQGVGGGFAATIARAVVIDVARGDLLARMMSVLMALGGLAPAIAPVVGGVVLSLGGSWRLIFWLLVCFGAIMTITAAAFVPETLAVESRHRGGIMFAVRGFRDVLRVRSFVAYMLTAAFSGFAMLGYIANASYVLQGMGGLSPLAYSLFFASTALAQVALSAVNVRLIGRFRPQQLVSVGLASAGLAVVLITIAVVLWGAALVPVCIGFFVLMASQALIFGNSSALAVGQLTARAGSAAALQGITLSLAWALSAPLATMGGVTTAVPMVLVMIVGVLGSAISFALARRRPAWSSDPET